ncbi:hypothetical protein fugu_015929 [Takifugu bimaculatus]|uniref:SET domain-containing protein n=1 Tax=Takifugu bimaculatus TaxID=433685 RepID=A0A4Z2BX05_9TELE|nr:hypothetical protein fugu_015929 [Takifugu bimaculatus]
MSVSLSSIPAMLKDRSYHGGMLKGTPVRAFYPGPLPGPHNPYLDFFPRTNNLLNPLKSLGRLVSDTPAHLPLSLHGGAPPYLGHGAQHAPVLQEPMLSASGHPYLSQMLPGHALYSKPEELAAVVTEHAAGPLSSDFSSPSSERSTSSSGSTSPPKESFYRFGIADPSPKKTRTSYNFTEDDLFMVLYGYSSNQERSVGHAISGVALPEKPVSDSHPLPLDKQALELPEGLTILQACWGNLSHRGVFADARSVHKGTRFGPFQGKLVNTSEIKTYDDNTLMWEVFENGKLSHFVDGRGGLGNWMSLVKCARFPDEQNLIAVQVEGQIFYEACKDIQPGQELLVWYGDCYMQFLGIPLTLKEAREDSEALLPTEDAGEGFKCDRCGKVFAYKYYRDKHLKYTRCVDQGDRKFPCHLCKQIVREEGPVKDPHPARPRKAQTPQVFRVREEFLPVVQSQQTHARALRRAAIQMRVLQQGLYCLQHPAHAHPPALRGAAVQVQALREGLRLSRRPRQPRPADPRQRQAACVRAVRRRVPGGPGAPVSHQEPQKNPGQLRSPVSSTQWFTEGSPVYSHRQAHDTETLRTKPPLPQFNHPKLGVPALEVRGHSAEIKPKIIHILMSQKDK